MSSVADFDCCKFGKFLNSAFALYSWLLDPFHCAFLELQFLSREVADYCAIGSAVLI